MGTKVLFVIWVIIQASNIGAVHVGVLLSFTLDTEGFNYGPAVNVAIDTIKQEGFAENVRISYRLHGCDPKRGTEGILQLREDEDVDVILGPLCSSVCVPSGYYMGYWNLPFFPEACTDYRLEDKKVYNTVVRVGAPYDKMGDAFIDMFQKYVWTRAIFITQAGLCDLGADGIMKALKTAGIEVAEWIRTEDTLTDEEIDNYLERTRSRARVILLCHVASVRRRLLYRAQDLDMIKDYTYIYYWLLPEPDHTTPWETGDINYTSPEELAYRKQAFYSLKQVTMADVTGPRVDAYLNEVQRRMADPPWNYNNTRSVTAYALFLHDAAYLYLLLVNETLAEGKDFRNGTLLLEKARNRQFQGITGKVILDGNADREPNYWIWHYGPGMAHPRDYAYVDMNLPRGQRIDEISAPYWHTENGKPPPAVPVCGLLNEFCPESTQGRDIGIIVAAVVVVCAVVCTGAFYHFYRKRKTEEDLQKMSWKVNYKDIEFSKKRFESSMASAKSMHTGMDGSLQSLGRVDGSVHAGGAFGIVGTYKGVVVSIQNYEMPSIVLSRQDLIELKMRKEMNHENVTQFIGACVDAPNICVLHQLCSRGSLQDIIENDDIKLDNMFKNSLINDLVNGMCYIHKSGLVSHGRLESATCAVDSRWVLRVGGFGLRTFSAQRIDTEVGEYQKFRDLMWRAPELLRMDDFPPYGTQAGDVYSFAIILQEIYFRALPFFMDNETPKEIVARVRQGLHPPHRPKLPDNNLGSDVNLLITSCWDENPDNRPSFQSIKRLLWKINKGQKMNILDNMVYILERYATNLEEIVQQRTSELVEEKRKTDQLLYRMLPRTVADQLKKGQTVEPEIFESVTIFFSDIVGFTTLSSESSPIQVIDFLNDLYTSFDETIELHDVYKVETIGDAYMVVSGLPTRNQGRHVTEIANMALDLLSLVTHFRIRHQPSNQLKLRIGLHTGKCAAGVVGLAMPRYCLFGDTVNYASRMESNGLPFKIHISMECKEMLDRFHGYHTESRGQIEVKGKGLLTTHWLTGREGFDKPLPES